EFRTALALRPDPDGHNHIGALLQRLGRYQEAAFEFQKAISLAPDYVVAYMNLGETFLQAKQPQEAILWFEKSTRIKPDLQDAYLKLCDVYLDLNRPADAILILKKGLQRTRGLFSIALRLAWLLAIDPDAKLRDGSQAMLLAKKACEKTDYSNPAALDVLAAAYAETGKFDQATKLARKASRLASQSERFANLAPGIQRRIALYVKNRPYRRQANQLD
ncbi:MAG: tetratricopeptide repeat protein, partial [bacterium]